MGMTMQQLAATMTAQEFGQHYAMEREEPLAPAVWHAVASLLAAVANGALKPPSTGRIWAAHDFMPELWADVTDPAVPGAERAARAPETITVEQIMARARMAGMVH